MGVGRATRVGGHEEAPATNDEKEDMLNITVLRVERCIFASLNTVTSVAWELDNLDE